MTPHLTTRFDVFMRFFPPHVFIYLQGERSSKDGLKTPNIDQVTDSSCAAERCSSGALDDRNIWSLSSAICRNVLLSQVCSNYFCEILGMGSWWWISTDCLNLVSWGLKGLRFFVIGTYYCRHFLITSVHFGHDFWTNHQKLVGLSPRVKIHLEFQGRLNQNTSAEPNTFISVIEKYIK